MNITVYLPDEIGRWAKDQDLNLSRLLREAVVREQNQRTALAAMTDETSDHELVVELDGHLLVAARLRAKQLAWDGRNQWLYTTQDGTALVYDNDGGGQLYWPGPRCWAWGDVPDQIEVHA